MRKTKSISSYLLEIDRKIPIQGTNADRKRKVRIEDIPVMCQLHERGASWSLIAKTFGYKYATVRYNCDPEFRDSMKQSSTYGKHYGPVSDLQERVIYKLTLHSTDN